MSENQGSPELSHSEPSPKTLRQRFSAVRHTVSEAIKAGLSHPKAKPSDISMLRRTAFTAAEAQAHANKDALQEAKENANTDFLTGLPNMRGAEVQFKEMNALSNRVHRELTVGMMDLVGFGDINNNYGHAKGDEVLKAVGRFFSQSLRKGDIFARYGGDEFAAALAGADIEHAQSKFDELRPEFKKAIKDQFGLDLDFRCKFAQQDAHFSKSLKELTLEADPKGKKKNLQNGAA